MGRLVPAFDYLVDDLAHASQLDLLTTRDLEPEARLVLWVLRDGRGGEGILASPDAFFGLLQQIAERHTRLDLVDATFLYLRIVSPESAAADLAALAMTATRKYPEGARIAMNSFQKLYEQGRQEGLQAGEQRGKAKTLRLLLETRFGALTELQLARLEALDVAALDEALLRIFAADRLEDVIG